MWVNVISINLYIFSTIIKSRGNYIFHSKYYFYNMRGLPSTFPEDIN